MSVLINSQNFSQTIGLRTSKTTFNGLSGTLVCSQPFVGSSYKKVVIYCNGFQGTVTYTFPTAFLQIPSSMIASSLSALTISSLSTTQISLTSAAPLTGFLFLEGY